MNIPRPPATSLLPLKARCYPAFSLAEILVTICVLALLASTVLLGFGGQRTAVSSAKLSSDVTVLNQAVRLYVAEGGQLPPTATSDDVLARLKTRSSAEFARRHVGTVTGRFIDPRLVGRALSDSEASTDTPRAVWNSARQEFIIATSGPGIGSFHFDDAQLDLDSVEEDRERSAMLFNRADGWIWEWGGNPDAAPVEPDRFAMYISAPLEPPPAGSPQPPPPPPSPFPAPPDILPTPTILPMGGEFYRPRFPTSISIFPNGAPADYSVLQYRIDDGAWTPYTAAFPVSPGAKVYARSISLDRTRYLDSPEDMETYILLIHHFTGTVAPEWVDISGKNHLVKTVDNSNADQIKATYGQPTQNADSPNNLEFRRSGIMSVPPDTDFRVGEIIYFNGTVAFGTEATAADLKLNIQLLTPVTQSGSAAAHLSLQSTPNTTDAVKSADYIQLDNPRTDFVVQVDGMTYTLQLRFANIKAAEGWTDGTKLNVYENSTGHADLVGRFVTQ